MVSFNEIPSNLRVPLFYAEFDNSRAVQGTVQKVFKGLVIGQKTSAGTATANVPVLVTSKSQATSLFGAGSILDRMFARWFDANTFTAVYALPLSDNGSGVAATGTIVTAGPATASGTIALYIGGQLIQVAVVSGDSANTIAASINAAINAVTSLGVTSSVSTNTVTLTAKNKGTNGNGIDIRYNYQDDEALPAGVGLTVTAMASGATNPLLTSGIAALGDEQYDVIAMALSDATSLTALEAELASRWSALRQIEGFAIIGKDDTVGNLSTFGNGRNSKHIGCLGFEKFPQPAEELAANAAALAAFYLAIDPARPLQAIPMPGIMAPALADRFTLSERNILLFDGISTMSVASDGTVYLERVNTMYQVNTFGSPDTSYLRIETMFTLAYLRYSMKARFTSKYPRHKLARDGIRVGPGQAIITPKVAKAEAISLFRDWEEAGLVEDVDQFKNDLVCVISPTDPDRLEMVLPPNLVNQFRVLGVQIQFLL